MAGFGGAQTDESRARAFEQVDGVPVRAFYPSADTPGADRIWLPGGLDILVMNLLQDGFLVPTGANSGVIMAGVPSRVEYLLTPAGRQFVARWVTAKALD